MSFAHPYILLFLWAVLPLLAVAWWGISRRTKILSGYASGEGLSRIAGEALVSRRYIRAFLSAAAAAAMIVALAGPQYGFRWEKIEQKGVDIIVALDCSRSMLAEDIDPTRLDRAKYEIIDLLGMLAGDRVGLVAFAGSAFLQCPLTMDYGAFHLFLEALSPDMLPVGGTNLGSAVQTAVSGFSEKEASDKAVILITDGEQTVGPDPIEAARQAAEKKIRLFCIGVGDAQGAPVPEDAGGFKKDRDGKIVLSRLDEETLKQMASLTGGIYVRSVAGDMDLDAVYRDNIREKMDRTTLESGKKRIWENRFQWFLALALLCLAAGMIIPTGRVPVALLVLVMVGCGVTGARADGVYNDVRQGRQAYDGREYEKALKHFIDAQLADPENATLYYNIGGAYYKTENYDEAAGNYKKALEMFQDDEPLKKDTLYNLGNTYFKQRDFQRAIESYQQALDIDKNDTEARENLDLAKKALEEQQKQQQQRKDQQQDQEGQSQPDKDQGRQAGGDGEKQPDEGKQETSPSEKKEQPEQRADDTAKSGARQPPEGESGDGSTEQRQSPAERAAAQSPEKEDKSGRDATSPIPDWGEGRLERLRDNPGAAMIPDYRQREVEQDW